MWRWREDIPAPRRHFEPLRTDGGGSDIPDLSLLGTKRGSK